MTTRKRKAAKPETPVRAWMALQSGEILFDAVHAQRVFLRRQPAQMFCDDYSGRVIRVEIREMPKRKRKGK